MLEQHMKKLCKEWQIPEERLATQVSGCYSIPLGEGLTILASKTPSGGYMLKSTVAPYPTTRGETFATDAMLANLFGQGTQGATLGLSLDGNALTLSQNVEYEVDFKEFTEILEDFITSIDVWREEALKK